MSSLQTDISFLTDQSVASTVVLMSEIGERQQLLKESFPVQKWSSAVTTDMPCM